MRVVVNMQVGAVHKDDVGRQDFSTRFLLKEYESGAPPARQHWPPARAALACAATMNREGGMP
jgi:hypothetical protein